MRTESSCATVGVPRGTKFLGVRNAFRAKGLGHPVPRGTSETALNTKGMVSAELSRKRLALKQGAESRHA
jgi:hypothetical protein